MKSDKELIVYWAPIFDTIAEPLDWDILYYEPERLLDSVQENKVQKIGNPKLRDMLKKKHKRVTHPNHNLFRCPAVQNSFRNNFVIRNPIETYIKIDPIDDTKHYERGYGVDNDRIKYLSNNWIECDITHESNLVNCDLFVYSLRWIFFTEEESLNFKFSSPWFSKAPHLKYGSVVPGTFDCGKWFRSVMPEFNLWPGTGEFRILEDEPLAYVEFKTERSVKLVRFKMNDILTKISRTTAMSSSWEGNVPLWKRYLRFSKTRQKDIILKEIRKNVI